MEVQITGLDITIRNFDKTVKRNKRNGPKRCLRIYCRLRGGGDITSLTIWGITVHTSWLKEYSSLLFEEFDTPKYAYYEVLQAYLDAGFKVE